MDIMVPASDGASRTYSENSIIGTKARQVSVDFPAKRQYYRSNTLYGAMGARIGSTGSYVGTQQGVGGGVGVSRSLANHCVLLVVTQLRPGSPQRFSSANPPALRSAFVLTEHF